MKENEIITREVPSGVLAHCREWAKNSSIGGSSNVRKGQERQDSLSEDQMTGHVGAAMFCWLMYGNIYAYKVARWYADRYPTEGDGGSDLPGTNIDVKSTLIRNLDKPLLTYRLCVRPRERHPDTVYVQTLVLPPDPDNSIWTVMFVGWAHESELPEQVEASGDFKGAYVLPVSRLNPVMPIIWSL